MAIWTPKLIKPPSGTPLQKGYRLSKNLVAFWMMNGGGTTAYDSSVNDNTGTPAGAVTAASAKFGAGVSMGSANTNHLDCGSDPSLDFGANPFTLLAWINVPSPAFEQGTIMQMKDFYAEGFWFGYKLNTGEVYFEIEDSIGIRARITGGGSFNMCDGAWHQVVALRDNDNFIRFYMDGVLDQGAVDASAVGSVTTNDQNWFIGAHEQANSGLNGTMDHGAAWNRALTSVDIWSLYVDPFQMFRPSWIYSILGGFSGAAPAGNAGIMTTNTGWWGPTY